MGVVSACTTNRRCTFGYNGFILAIIIVKLAAEFYFVNGKTMIINFIKINKSEFNKIILIYLHDRPYLVNTLIHYY